MDTNESARRGILRTIGHAQSAIQQRQADRNDETDHDRPWAPEPIRERLGQNQQGPD